MEQQGSNFIGTKRYAIVTGSNKGIGFEMCKQLASKGIEVILTARDEKRGLEALEKLYKDSELSKHVVFHQLDVTDPINNAGVGGVTLDALAFRKAVDLTGGIWPEQANWKEMSTQPHELAEECLKTNYYGAKSMVEALLPILQLSDWPRIINVSSFLGLLEYMPNEWAKRVFSDTENLTEERIGEVVVELLKDLKEGMLETKGWPTHLAAYKLSKAALNAYTMVLAKKNPSVRINSVCPGFVKTDINCNTGSLTTAEGAQRVVSLALLPNSAELSGLFYVEQQVLSF